MNSAEQGKERHSWIKLSVIVFVMAVLMALTAAGGQSDTSFNMDDPDTIALLKVSQVFLVFLLFIVPAFVFAQLWTNAKVRYLQIHVRPALITMVLAGIAILFASPLINWLAVMNQKMDLPESLSGIEAWMRSSEEAAAEMTKAFTAGTSVGVLISNLFVVAFMAALSEELFFRGVVQKVSIECFKNPHAGIWFGAILFSAFHMQFYGFLPRMLMGSFLGYFFWWSGSLWPSILAHFINNGSAVFVTWLINRGQLDATAETLGTQSADTIYVIVSAVLVIACLVLIRLLERKRRNNGGHTLHTSSQ